MDYRTYTTERGVTIGVVPIPLLLDKVQAAHPATPRPAYTEHLAGGGTQEVEITDAMAEIWARENPDSWQEHAGKWAAYQAAAAARSERVNDAIWRAIVRKAVVVDLPADEGWIEEQRELGITVPDDPRERKAHYIWTEVIGGTTDVIRITALANGADVTEEALATAEASFRDQLQRRATERLSAQAGAMAAGG